MSKKSPTKSVLNKNTAAESAPAIFDYDEFIIPSLVEAHLKNIPLSQEEHHWLTLIEQDETLHEEYLGLLAVMQAMTDTPEQSSGLIYLYTDNEARLYSAQAEQIEKRQRLVEDGLELTGATIFTPPGTTAQIEITDLGVLLDFSSPSMVRLRPLAPKIPLGAVAETAQSYQPQSIASPDRAWHLYADLSGKSYQLLFDPHGNVQLPAELRNVQGWKLIKAT